MASDARSRLGHGGWTGRLQCAHDDQLDAGELIGLYAAQVAAKESRCRDEQSDLVLFDQTGESRRLQGVRIGDQIEPLDDRVPHGDGGAETVKKREAIKDFVFSSKMEPTADGGRDFHRC